MTAETNGPGREPVAWIQPDHLAKARIAPFLCRIEPQHRDDFVPIYVGPSACCVKHLPTLCGDCPARWCAAAPPAAPPEPAAVSPSRDIGKVSLVSDIAERAEAEARTLRNAAVTADERADALADKLRAAEAETERWSRAAINAARAAINAARAGGKT